MSRSSTVSSISPRTVCDPRAFLRLVAGSVFARAAINVSVIFGLVFCFSGAGVAQEKEPIEMSVMAVNPSSTKTQTVQIKAYLPKEVTPDVIIDSAGLDIEFDSEQSMYYAYKEQVNLNPGETKTFTIELQDVWVIEQGRLDSLKKQTESIITRLEGSPFYDSAKLLGETIYKALETVAVTQNDTTVSRKSHIGIYRNNLKIVNQVKDDVDRLEKQLVVASSLPKPDVLEQAKLKTESPTENTSWMIIFIIMLFIGMLAGVFFFTWHAQARATKELISEARSESFPERKDSNKEASP